MIIGWRRTATALTRVHLVVNIDLSDRFRVARMSA